MIQNEDNKNIINQDLDNQDLELDTVEIMMPRVIHADPRVIHPDIVHFASSLIDPEIIVVCKHCGKQVDQSTLVGLSLTCPKCGKPQNGHPKDPTLDPYDNMTVICKHCGKPINQALLRGISLICPVCGMPQNGQPHPKILAHKTP